MSNLITRDLSSDGVLTLTLNRKPVNAFSGALFHALHSSINNASDDPNVRVVVLTSAFEKYFTAGLDLNDTGFPPPQPDVARQALLIRQHMKQLQDAVTSLEKCRVPVIVVLSGIVFGAGVDIATACDIRIASSSTSFSVKEVDIGIAADVGTLQRLPKVVGNNSKVRELVYTARPFGSQEALEIGLLSRVVDGGLAEALKEGKKLAAEIASKSPMAITGSKHLLNYSRDRSVEEGLEYTSAWNSFAVQTKDMKDAFAAFHNKSKASFEPLAKL